MAALGQLSRVLLRSALTQSRRQFSAAAAEHGEHSGTRGVSFEPAARFYFDFFQCQKCLIYSYCDLATLSLAAFAALVSLASISGHQVDDLDIVNLNL